MMTLQMSTSFYFLTSNDGFYNHDITHFTTLSTTHFRDAAWVAIFVTLRRCRFPWCFSWRFSITTHYQHHGKRHLRSVTESVRNGTLLCIHRSRGVGTTGFYVILLEIVDCTMSLYKNSSVVFINESAINDTNEDNSCFSLFMKTYIHLTSSQHEFAEQVSYMFNGLTRIVVLCISIKIGT